MGESKIIFSRGKETALKKLFSSDGAFPYIALGYDSEGKGFTDDISDYGFKEISNDDTYHRIELSQTGEPEIDSTTGKVTVEFLAELDYNNIKATTSINQLAVVDSGTANDGNTIYYSATTFPTFEKNEGNAIAFTIGFRF